MIELIVLVCLTHLLDGLIVDCVTVLMARANGLLERLSVLGCRCPTAERVRLWWLGTWIHLLLICRVFSMLATHRVLDTLILLLGA